MLFIESTGSVTQIDQAETLSRMLFLVVIEPNILLLDELTSSLDQHAMRFHHYPDGLVLSG
jgi:ABC-type iron transport system FetAB ATPase subunit